MTNFFSYSVKTLLMASLVFGAVACEDEDTLDPQGNWVALDSHFPGVARSSAVCFTIRNEENGVVRDYAFVGTGANTNKTEERERFRDFYMCTWNNDYLTPKWTNKYIEGSHVPFTEAVASMPQEAPARNGAVGFALQDANGDWYGYVGLGYDGVNYLKDFWRYSVKENSWERLADYPGDSVRFAVSFVLDDPKTGHKCAYVGTGEDFDNEYRSDFYKYDPYTNTWSESAVIGTPRTQAMSFVYDNKGYVLGGFTKGVNDFFSCYNPATDSWEQLNRLTDRTDYQFDDDYRNIVTSGGVAFVLYPEPTCYKYSQFPRVYTSLGGGSGIIGGGYSVYTWEYNPVYDYWTQKSNFEQSGRKFATAFVLEIPNVVEAGINAGRQIPFVTLGGTGDLSVSGSGGTFSSEMYTFNPFMPYESHD